MGQSNQGQFEIVTTLDERIWSDFVQHHPQGNIFHSPEMFQVFNCLLGYRPLLHAAVDEDRKVLAFLPTVQVTLIGRILRRLTTRAIAYGGVLCSEGPEGEAALRGLLHSYSQEFDHKILFTEFRNLSDMSALQFVLSDCAFTYEDHLNYLIDLNCSSEQLMQNIGSRTRHNIRRGLRKGNVIVEEVSERCQLRLWYEIIKKTYRSVGVPLADISLFNNAYDILSPKRMIKYWLARVGDVYVAASAELLYKNVMYGWYGGVDRQYSSDILGELLMWHILDWGASKGYEVYDFGGAGKPGEEYGVRDFKAKFGGHLVCFGRNTKIHSPQLLKLSEQGYKIYRHLIRNRFNG